MKTFKEFLAEQLPTTIPVNPQNVGNIVALSPQDGKKTKKKIIKKETSDKPPQKIMTLS